MEWLESRIKPLVSQLRLRLRALLRRREMERELEDELRFHIDMETEKNLREGLDPAEARRRAVLAFGSVERHKEEARDARGVRWLEDAIRDARYAARQLRKRPGFTAIAVATLALAIGATTAVFSVVDAVLIDPLPYPDADQLVSIRASAPGSEFPNEFGVSDELYLQYRDNADGLQDVGMYWFPVEFTLRAEDRIERLLLTRATPSVFTTLGARPALGRLPTQQDDARGVVISHWLWTNWFGADSTVIGRSYEFGEATRTVIGVMGPDFRFPDERSALWMPWVVDAADVTPGGFGPSLVGRLAPGAGHSSLAARLAILARRLPDRFGGSAGYRRIIERHRPVVRSLEEEVVGDVAMPLWLLLGTVAVVLLIACANVANLFTVRAESRRRELAVRRALGAGRARLVRTQMVEALMLAALGGAGGALLAWAGVPVLVRAAPEHIPNLDAAGLDPPALLFTAGVSILAACAFGLLPALRFSNPGLAGGLRQAGRVSESSGRWGRNALVVLQTASALVLLVGAALLVRSFVELTRVDPGYETADDILTFQISPAGDRFADALSFARFHEAFLERLAALPGVESVGLTRQLPLDGGALTARFGTEQTAAAGETPPLLNFAVIGGDYFQAMGIGLQRGRLFERGDFATGAGNVIFSRAAAERLWPDEDPLGRRVRIASDTTGWLTVVGVVEDIFFGDLRQEAVDPFVYLPMFGPKPVYRTPAYVVQSTRARLLAPDIRDLIREAAPESPIFRVSTMDALAARSMARLSFTMLMLAIAAGLALVLGAVGLYGVLSYVVSQRTRELAVRMALGAQASAVRRMVVLEGGRVALVGVALGLVAAVGLTRALANLLFGVEPLDAPTFAATAGVMLAVALLASYLPARRASSVDPMRTLRVK